MSDSIALLLLGIVTCGTVALASVVRQICCRLTAPEGAVSRAINSRTVLIGFGAVAVTRVIEFVIEPAVSWPDDPAMVVWPLQPGVMHGVLAALLMWLCPGVLFTKEVQRLNSRRAGPRWVTLRRAGSMTLIFLLLGNGLAFALSVAVTWHLTLDLTWRYARRVRSQDTLTEPVPVTIGLHSPAPDSGAPHGQDLLTRTWGQTEPAEQHAVVATAAVGVVFLQLLLLQSIIATYVQFMR